MGAGRVEAGEGVGQVGGHLAGVDDDQVEVGHQGERAAALGGAVVQDDGAGLSDGDRYKIFEGNARKVFPRLDERLRAGLP